jgi:hypothetical protein
MIERYIHKGIRVKWTCPKPIDTGPKDGTIIVNPPSPPGSWKYDGVDPELGLGLPHVSTLGLQMGMVINFNWLSYIHGQTPKISPTSDVLTGPMSGCIIAVWTENGQRFVGHVGTIDYNDDVNKKVKSTFAGFMPQDVQGFSPSNAWDQTEMMDIRRKINNPNAMGKVMALVTDTDVFYSIFMITLGGQDWVIAGKKQIPAMHYHELQFALLGTRPRR